MRCDHAIGWAGRYRSALKYAVLIAGWLTASHACALQQRSDLFVHLNNATGVMLSVCDADGSDCETLLPGATRIESYAMGRPNVAFIGTWIPTYVVKVCGRIVPLKMLVSEQAISEDWSSLTFHLTMSQKRYQRECG